MIKHIGYIETKRSDMLSSLRKGNMRIKFGDTTKDDHIERIKQQRTAALNESLIAFDLTYDLAHFRDKKVHSELLKSGWVNYRESVNVIVTEGVTEVPATAEEWFEHPLPKDVAKELLARVAAAPAESVDDYFNALVLDDLLGEYQAMIQKFVVPNVKILGEVVSAEREFVARSYQADFIEWAGERIEESNGADCAKFLALLAARSGKTPMFLEVAHRAFKLGKIDVMLLPCFWHGVFSSFEDDSNGRDAFKHFAEDTVYVGKRTDMSLNRADEINAIIEDGKLPIVAISLHNEEETRQVIENINAKSQLVVVDESDIGAHTEGKSKILDYINASRKTVAFYASGTGMERIARAAGDFKDYYSLVYSEIEACEPKAVKRVLVRTDLSPLAAALDADGITRDDAPSWNKYSAKISRYEGFWTKFYENMFGKNTLDSRLNLRDMAESVSMQIGVSIGSNVIWQNVSTTNSQMKALCKIAQGVLGEDGDVFELNGINSTNESAGKDIKAAIAAARLRGKEKFLIIANQMGSRSCSVPQAEIFVNTADSGSSDSLIQKTSRVLTPMRDESKTHAIIFDPSFNRDRSFTNDIIIDEAVQLARKTGSIPAVSLKFVFNSVNIFDYDENYHAHMIQSEQEVLGTLGSSDNLARAIKGSLQASLRSEDKLTDFINIANGFSFDEAALKKSMKAASATTSIKANIAKIKKGSNGTLSQAQINTISQLLVVIDALSVSGRLIRYYFGKDDCPRTYVECIDGIASDATLSADFEQRYFGITAENVKEMINAKLITDHMLLMMNSILMNTIEGKS